MTLLAEWISPAVLRILALSLLHFLWQGAALAALAYVGLALCRRASVRYVVAVATLVAMLLSPAATLFVFRAQHASFSPSISVADDTVRPAADSAAVLNGKAELRTFPQPQFSGFSLLLLVEIWFGGVIVLSLRSIGGFFIVERIRRRESSCVADNILVICLELQDRMGIPRMVRYCQSLHLDLPAVVGWIRPVVLIPISAITGLSQAQLESVIAHELAHIRRYDAFVNLFQVAVETLLFYHPAVWWLGQRIRTEREHCCDDAAVAVCGSPVVYARALARLAGMKPAPQLAMALNGSPLVDRVARLLGSARDSTMLRAANLSAGVFCLSIALLAGAASLANAHKLHAQTPPAAPAAPARPAAPPAPRVPDGSVIIVRPGNPAEAPTAPPDPSLAPNPAAAPTAAPDSSAAPTAAPSPYGAPQTDPQQPKQSYIDSLKSAGLSDLTVDELIALKVQGVTAEYVKSMKELGMKSDPDELIGMKVQGITAEYVKAMRTATSQTLDADALIGMKIQGVTPEYVKQMHDLGLKIDADDLVGMKIQGVTPEYVKEMRDLGLKVDSDELVGMKIQGVTPEYVKQMRAATGKDLDVDTLLGMKIQGVTPAYIKELQSAGFKVDPEEAIAAKIQGVTPEFIATARSHGFKDLTLEKLIALKHAGVFDAEK
jgi:beta-lactamase regulating signal transducer with metallopeptidase domain